VNRQQDKTACVLLALKGLFLTAVGLFFLFHAWADRSAYVATLDHGVETTAYITQAKVVSGRYDSKSYSMALSWRDRTGQPRTEEGVSVSPALWQKLVSGNSVVERNIAVKYLEENRGARPIVIFDTDETMSRSINALYWSVGITALGALGFAGFIFFAIKLRRSGPRAGRAD
jgi:hypothetical protein